MQLLCILSKSHFQFGIQWKDCALQHLEESICILGPIDYRLLKIDMNLKQLSLYTFFLIFFFNTLCSSEVSVHNQCKHEEGLQIEVQPPNRNHLGTAS